MLLDLQGKASMMASFEMSHVNRHVGEGLRLAREVRRVSQAQLAQDLGISPERLERIEAGEEEATSTDLHLSARALGVNVSMFFDGLVMPRANARTGDDCRGRSLGRRVNANLGARMRLAREVRGLSLERLAEAAGIERDRLEGFEYGEEEAAASDLHSLARVLDVAVAYFFEGATDPVPYIDPPGQSEPRPMFA
jgi:transcriptional regulator with XRE-family HTH domain